MIPDQPNWAFDLRAKEIISRLKHKYDFYKVYLDKYNKVNPKIDFSKYDLIYPFYIGQHVFVKNILSEKKVCTGIFSHDSWKDKFEEAVENLKLYKAVTAGNPELYEIFSKKLNNVFYTPTGVNAGFFKPLPKKSNEFTVGWCGNPERSVKGYEEFVVPACKKAGIKLLTASPGKNFVPRENLPEFYSKIDCLLCTSESEGGAPNPNFEAASCGKAIITTNVGLMPEFIYEGNNGFFIERNIRNISKTLTKLKNDPALCKKLGLNARKAILEKWDWNIMINNYEKVFDYCLK